MKKSLAFIFVAIVLLSSCKKENTEIFPTTENLSGVWQATEYRLNGVAATGSDFTNNYFMFGADNSYSARVGSGDTEDYSFGAMTIAGNEITLFSTGDPNSTFKAEAITKSTMVFTTIVGSDIYNIGLSRVNNPTTYRIQNLTAYPMTFSSYYYDTKIKDFSYHGTIAKGNTSTDKVYTKRNKISIGGSYAALNFRFITIYPQTIRAGQENVLVLSDTTKVYYSTSSAMLPLSETILKSMILKDKATLKEALSKVM